MIEVIPTTRPPPPPTSQVCSCEAFRKVHCSCSWTSCDRLRR